MFSWLKKHFIPHEGNEHRPHILRDSSIRYIVAAVIFFEIFAFLIPTLTRINMTGGMAEVLPAVLDDLTNVERQAQSLGVLTVSPLLNNAAQMKANDMATKGYFAHTSPEGKTPWYWIGLAGYKYQYAGENLAVNFSDSKDVTAAWMNSPTHKANIVKGNYTEIGTGVATGIYEGRETTFVAQVYANPLPGFKEAQAEQSANVINVPIPATTNSIPTTPQVAVTIPTPQKEPTKVLGAEVAPKPVAVKKPPLALAVPPKPADVVTPNPSVVEPVKAPTFWQKLLASPRNTTNIILYVVFGIVALALLLYIFIKLRNHHIDLITNGLVVLAIVGGVFLVNYYFSYRDMIITTSFDYSNTTTQ